MTTPSIASTAAELYESWPANSCQERPGQRRRAESAAHCGVAGLPASRYRPQGVSVAEVHDATAFAEIRVVEELDFVAQGEGGGLAEQGISKLGGRLPINVSGGLSVEAIRQQPLEERSSTT